MAIIPVTQFVNLTSQEIDFVAQLAFDAGYNAEDVFTGANEGILSLKETTSPSATSNVGKVYVKSSDSSLYFLDDSGTEYRLTSVYTKQNIVETPDGTRKSFTIPVPITSAGISLAILNESNVYISDTDFTISGTTITFISAPPDMRGVGASFVLISYNGPSSTFIAQSLDVQVVQWALSSTFETTSATFDSDGAMLTAAVVWPDGSTGTFTADTVSTSFVGSIDAYHVTYVPVSGAPKTVTQLLVTRDTNGYVVAQPNLTIV